MLGDAGSDEATGGMTTDWESGLVGDLSAGCTPLLCLRMPPVTLFWEKDNGEGRSGDNLDASLLSPEGGEGDKIVDGEGEETEVVKERFTSLRDGISALSRLKHGKSISISAAQIR